LLASQLSGDDLIDIVRLGRVMGDPEPDVLWVASAGRTFLPAELPIADRFSLVGELIDADADDLLDIWITRDVGWARGGDTVLSRQGDPDGEWVDVAPDLGVALEVDAMGLLALRAQARFVQRWPTQRRCRSARRDGRPCFDRPFLPLIVGFAAQVAWACPL